MQAHTDANPQSAPNEELDSRPQFRRQVIAIGGGKGGIGKSLISSNISVRWAQLGRQVVVMDADLGGANLHTCLGMQPPKATLSDFIARRVDNLGEVISQTPIKNLGLISGAHDFLAAANPKYTQKLRLLREISKLDVDSVVIDLGGGTGFNILDFFLIADHGVLVVAPEPTAIENAYRFIKAVYYRRLKTLELSWDLKPLVQQALKSKGQSGLQTPADLVRKVREQDPKAGDIIAEELARFPLKLIVNQCRSEEEMKLGNAICQACRKYFGIKMDFLGAVPHDDAVWRAVRKRRPVLLDAPDAPASQHIRNIVSRLENIR